MSYWTYYWAGKQVLNNMKESDRTGMYYRLDHTAGSGYFKAGISVGDTLYIVNWLDGALGILGRMRVGEMYDRSEAERRFGDNVYGAPDHISAEPGTATYEVFDALIPDESIDDIEFIARDGSLHSPKRNKKGQVEPQTFINVRQVTEETARMFDEALGFEADQDHDTQMLKRRVIFIVVARDDPAHERTIILDAQCSAEDVPPRSVEIEHSVSGAGALEDPEYLEALTRDVVERWCDENEVRIEDDLEDLEAAVSFSLEDSKADDSDADA